MNFITFEYVECKNLASVGNMPIRVELNRHNTTMVTGGNGVGKSTLLLDSICFALFGKSFKGVTKSQLVNTKNNKDLLCTVRFKRGNDTIKVSRGYKPAVFDIYINDKLLDQNSTTRDYQKYFEESILGIDYTTFTQIVMIGRANYIPFLSLSAKDKRTFVENVLGLEIFTHMSNIHKERCKIHEQLIQKLETNKRAILADIDKYESLIRQQEEYYRNAEHAFNTQKQRDIQRIEQSINDTTSKIDALRTQEKAFLALESVERYQTAYDDIQSQIRVSQHEMSTISKQLKFYESGSCPTCKQPLPNSEQMVSECSNNLESINNKVSSFTTLLAKFKQKIDSIKEQDIHQSRVIQQIHLLTHEVSRYNSELSRIIAKTFEPQSFDDFTVPLAKMKDELTAVEKQLTQANTLSSYLSLVSQLLKDTGLKTQILSDYIPTINQLINTNVKQLGLFATIKIDDTFDETIQMRGFDKMSYNQLSEGEKLRLNMAVMMAWRDVARYKSNMSCNLLIMDEIFDSSVDVEGTQAFTELLKSVSDLNVFVITHTPEKLTDSFRSQIKLQKVNGFTTLTQSTL